LTLASSLVALAVFAGLVGIASTVRQFTTEAGGRGDGRPAGRGKGRLRLKESLRRLGHLITSSPIRGIAPHRNLGARLAAAGEPAGLGMREWVAVKALCASCGCAAGALIGTGAPARIAVLAPLVGSVAAFAAPDFWLARLTKRRLAAAVLALPDMLDLLRVTVEAGMSPARAIGVVGSEFHGTLGSEWKRVAAEIDLGVARDEAFAGLCERLPADEIRSLIESLSRASRHGVPLGRALELQASTARERRRLQVRERAARAGPQIQLVVALMLVPAVLLIVAAGLLLELGRSGLFLPG
jgi:tight adherence protein C